MNHGHSLITLAPVTLFNSSEKDEDTSAVFKQSDMLLHAVLPIFDELSSTSSSDARDMKGRVFQKAMRIIL